MRPRGAGIRTAMKSGSRLEHILSRKEFAVTVEIAPTASADPTEFLTTARTIRGHADAFNVTDCPRALVKMSSLAGATLLLREGMEPVMQVTTRDRNRIALQADILGAAAIGVRNVLCLRGDDPSLGNEKDAKPVFDLETEEFIETLRRLRDGGTLRGGDAVDTPPRLFIGATSNPFGGDREGAFVGLREKVKAGADFIQTQGIYDVDAFDEWMHLVRKEWLHEKVHILAGVIPLKSAKMARFMNESVPGVTVPKDIIARLDRGSNAKAEGVQIAVEVITRLREIEGVSGVHIMAVNWDDAVRAIVKDAGLYPRPAIELRAT
ncbi:MAG TPA: methylenetetrahydrofolate reductase [Thermoplasmata archaeon]